MRVITALWIRNLKIFVRNKVQLAFTIIFPFFFLFVFSGVFKVDHIKDPVNYMLVGIIISTVFETSLNIATSTIEDMVSGFMREVLVSPIKRIYIAVGQLLSAATIAVFEGALLIVLGLIIGLRFHSFYTIILIIGVMIFVGIVFSSFGLFLATLVKNEQTFQIIKTAITMPFTFLSGAYIPLSSLPDILQIVARFNPMTYVTALFRTVTLEKLSLPTNKLVEEQLAIKIGNFIVTPFISFIIILIFGLVFLILTTTTFSKVDFSRINRVKAPDSDIWS